MEEKILVQGKIYNFKKFEKITLIIVAILAILFFVSGCIITFSYNIDDFEDVDYNRLYCDHSDDIERIDDGDNIPRNDIYQYVFNEETYRSDDLWELESTVARLNHDSAFSYALCTFYFPWLEIAICAGVLASLAIIFFMMNLAFSKISITVTNKRIYGKTALGKQVDLPVDSVSAIASSMMKGIAVATSSGKIIFKLIKNRDEVRNVIVDLLNDRQASAKNNIQAPQQEAMTGGADELKKYKDLLDSGVITQEEFDAKKKQLLGL